MVTIFLGRVVGFHLSPRRNTLKCNKKNSPPVLVEESVMERSMQRIKRLYKDEQGAALVEYTVLLGVMLVAVIGTIVLVGGWVNTKWVTLLTALSGS